MVSARVTAPAAVKKESPAIWKTVDVSVAVAAVAKQGPLLQSVIWLTASARVIAPVVVKKANPAI